MEMQGGIRWGVDGAPPELSEAERAFHSDAPRQWGKH